MTDEQFDKLFSEVEDVRINTTNSNNSDEIKETNKLLKQIIGRLDAIHHEMSNR